MGDSYLLTGAFPAEYGNAISGVMDMRLRKSLCPKNQRCRTSGSQNQAFSYFDTLQQQLVQRFQLGLIPILSYCWEF